MTHHPAHLPITVTAAAVLIFSLPAALTAQISFGPPTTLTSALVDLALPAIVTDFDGDGDTDVVQPYVFKGKYGFFANNGGTLSPPQILDGAQGAVSPVATDANGDGVMDLVSAAFPAIITLPGVGAGRLGSPISTAVRLLTSSLGVDDFDGDGIPDAFVVVEPQLFALRGDAEFHHGLGDGTFGSSVTIDNSGQISSGISTVGDLDGDGLADLVTGLGFFGATPAVRAFLSRGSGDFEIVTTEMDGPAMNLTLADLDGDGHGDLIRHGPAGLRVHRGLGNGSFGPKVTVDITPVAGVALGDFDNDGQPDIAASSASSSLLLIYRQNSPLRFDMATTVPGFSPSSTVNAVDIDGDGLPDLIASAIQPQIIWAQNTPRD